MDLCQCTRWHRGDVAVAEADFEDQDIRGDQFSDLLASADEFPGLGRKRTQDARKGSDEGALFLIVECSVKLRAGCRQRGPRHAQATFGAVDFSLREHLALGQGSAATTLGVGQRQLACRSVDLCLRLVKSTGQYPRRVPGPRALFQDICIYLYKYSRTCLQPSRAVSGPKG